MGFRYILTLKIWNPQHDNLQSLVQLYGLLQPQYLGSILNTKPTLGDVEKLNLNKCLRG